MEFLPVSNSVNSMTTISDHRSNLQPLNNLLTVF